MGALPSCGLGGDLVGDHASRRLPCNGTSTPPASTQLHACTWSRSPAHRPPPSQPPAHTWAHAPGQSGGAGYPAPQSEAGDSVLLGSFDRPLHHMSVPTLATSSLRRAHAGPLAGTLGTGLCTAVGAPQGRGMLASVGENVLLGSIASSGGSDSSRGNRNRNSSSSRTGTRAADDAPAECRQVEQDVSADLMLGSVPELTAAFSLAAEESPASHGAPVPTVLAHLVMASDEAADAGTGAAVNPAACYSRGASADVRLGSVVATEGSLRSAADASKERRSRPRAGVSAELVPRSAAALGASIPNGDMGTGLVWGRAQPHRDLSQDFMGVSMTASGEVSICVSPELGACHALPPRLQRVAQGVAASAASDAVLMASPTCSEGRRAKTVSNPSQRISENESLASPRSSDSVQIHPGRATARQPSRGLSRAAGLLPSMPDDSVLVASPELPASASAAGGVISAGMTGYSTSSRPRLLLVSSPEPPPPEMAPGHSMLDGMAGYGMAVKPGLLPASSLDSSLRLQSRDAALLMGGTPCSSTMRLASPTWPQGLGADKLTATFEASPDLKWLTPSSTEATRCDEEEDPTNLPYDCID